MAYETNDLHESAGTAAAEAKSAASNLKSEASRRAEQLRASAAEGLDSVAGSVHGAGDRVASAAHRAGDRLASGAQYLRGNDLGDVLDDLTDVIRDHPGGTILCAVAVGFVLGRAVYRS